MPKNRSQIFLKIAPFFIDFRHDCIILTCMYISNDLTLQTNRFRYKKILNFSRFCVSSLHRCHAVISVRFWFQENFHQECHATQSAMIDFFVLVFVLLLLAKNHVLEVRKIAVRFKKFSFFYVKKKFFFCEVLWIAIHSKKILGLKCCEQR